MPTYYPTGRTRTLEFSGDITAGLLLGLEGTGPSENSYYAYPETLSISAFTNLSVSAAISNIVVNPDVVLGYEVSARLTVNAGAFGDTDSDNTTYSDGPSGTDVEVSQSLNGTYSLSVPVEEVFWVEDITVEVDADGFPNYAGTAQKDGPKARIIRFGERPVEGETATATITMGGITATVNHVITSGEAASLVTHFAGVSGRSVGYDLLGTYLPGHNLTVTGDFGEEDFSVAYNPSDSTHEVDCNNGLFVRAAPNSADSLIFTDGSLTVYATRRFQLEGRQRTLTGSLSPDVDWKIQHKNGTTVTTSNDNYSWDQERYTASASFNGSAQTGASLNEFTEVWVALDTTSLAASDEDARDWRCLILGKLWDCYDVSHADETLTNTTSEWANVSNVTVGSGVTLTVAGGTGEATYTPPSNIDSEGFRYLDITIGSTDPSQPFTVELGSKSWSLTTGSGVTVVRLDLCAPNNAAVSTDDKTSRFPLDAPGTGDPTDSTFWGVSDIASITFSGLVDGQVYTVQDIELVGDSRLEVSVLSAFNNWDTAWVNGATDTTYHKPFWWGNADGRVADLPDMFFVDLTAPGDYYSWQTLDQLKGTVGNLGGWSMVNGAHSLPADGYHTRNRDAYWLCGAGATYNYTTDTWTDWMDRDASSTLTLPAQPGWDVVEVYGGAGDVFGGSSYPTTSANKTVLAVNKILRGRGWGLVYDLGEDPNPGVTVQLKQGATVRGSDTSETDGYYATGTPYGFGDTSHTIEAGSESINVTVANRMLHRGVFAVVVDALRALWNTVTPWGHYHRVSTDETSIRHHRAHYEVPSGGFDQETDVLTGTYARIAYSNGSIFLVTHDGSDTYWAQTDDDGGSYSTLAVLLTGAINSTIAATHDGYLVAAGFKYDSGTSGPGTIIGKRRGPGDSSWSSQFTFTDGSSNIAFSDSSFHFVESGGRLVMVAEKDGDSGPTEFYSTDLGASWTEV